VLSHTHRRRLAMWRRNGGVPVSEIQSHYDPHKTLAVHLDEIRAAAAGILRRHGLALSAGCPEVSQWFADSVSLHDAGKASRQFQGYIASPKKIQGSPKEKAHTPLSTLFALRHGATAGWDWKRTLAV